MPSISRRRLLAAAGLVGAAPAWASGGPPEAGGGSYPSRPIKIIAPFSAGGGTDFISRVLSTRLAQALGQPIVVENRAGANGAIGADAVAKAAPDGYTLLIGTAGSNGINAAVYEKLPFDTVRDFAGISLLARAPMLLLAHPSVKANNAQELIAEVKRSGVPYSYSTAGIGSVGHAAGVLFAQTTGAELTHVPYKGAAPAVVDLMSGQVKLMFGTTVSTLQYVRAGNVKVLGVTTAQPSPSAPGVVPLAQQGLPGFDVATWYGLLAPGRTPPAIVEHVSARLRAVLAEPEVQQQFLDQKLEIVGNTPAEFDAQVRREVEKWTRIGKALR